MANQEHVERLKRSIKEWNAWREEHPEIWPDLSHTELTGADLSDARLGRVDLSDVNLSSAGLWNANLSSAVLSNANLNSAVLWNANLSHANLVHADLNRANLNRANLSGVNLSDANLSGANLIDANLSGANLNRANLSRAYISSAYLWGVNLSGANLIDANLSSANLGRVDLSDANLSNANFTQTYFSRTIFAWVDLSGVKGLETSEHHGPSIVHINSVTLPHYEPARLHFLRGVGFTETQIEYLPSLLTPRPIQYQSLFISYASQDRSFAQRLYTDLRKKDVPCWFAPHDLRPGTPILRGLEEAIHWSDRFLLILSKDAANSPWIEREVDAALHQEIQRGQDVLFPIRLDNAVLESTAGWATRLRHRHIGDFTGWQDDPAYQQAFTTLLQHLKVDRPPTP